ncbi:uncharacterized protein LOC133380990 [Rhineura floridana]|uniref:uncharacterized protein LOC133380990 n=1 Tax=Rhineura floridana TaxID=261503 RepID=UPI002AC865BA|nr:uncharacterized protein LOC133380990 [Rhineura floridana]XP_061475294.1 uncharacterized protein LOC133380990 [Rhineura floridana]
MPKKTRVRSLQRLCLENVAGHMHQIWVKAYVENHPEEHNFHSVTGPFSELPGVVVEELLQLLGERKRLSRPVLRLLLVPQLTVLNLGRCKRVVNKAIAQIIKVRCKILSSLDLQGCSRISVGALVDLMKALPCLTKLSLLKTRCNAQVLSAVGSCCQRLRELDISFCHRVSPGSLLHLAYDQATDSLCCPALQVLKVLAVNSRPLSQDLVWPVVFVLLALPSLTFLEVDFVPEAVYLIHAQQFGIAPLAPGFPSLEELARCRIPTHTEEARSCRVRLALKQMHHVTFSLLPVACAVCPQLATVSVLLGGGPALVQSFVSWRSLAHLSIDCCSGRNLTELLPVVASLKAQLQSLAFSGFTYEDEQSFCTLLGHCLNLQKFWADLLPPANCASDGKPVVEALEWDNSSAPHEFPYLSDVYLVYSDWFDPISSRQEMVFTASLVSLLKHSPCLEILRLCCLPFSLDGVFEEVLKPQGTALVHLRRLSLLQVQVSSSTIHLLLSADNQLSFLDLHSCMAIHETDYDDFLRRVSNEGFELTILWE